MLRPQRFLGDTNMAKFRNYFFIGDVDLRALENLHNLVEEYKNSFFTNHEVQNFLLNDGRLPEKERPTSFHDLYDAVFIRTRTSVHLGILEKMIEAATSPKLVILRREKEGIISPEGHGVVYPNNTAVKINLETPEGYSSLRVEEIQRR